MWVKVGVQVHLAEGQLRVSSQLLELLQLLHDLTALQVLQLLQLLLLLLFLLKQSKTQVSVSISIWSQLPNGFNSSRFFS